MHKEDLGDDRLGKKVFSWGKSSLTYFALNVGINQLKEFLMKFLSFALQKLNTILLLLSSVMYLYM